jgi:hypothetical protein
VLAHIGLPITDHHNALADAGHLTAALSLLTASLAARHGSSDRAWADPAAYGTRSPRVRRRPAAPPRAALPPRAHRTGHPSRPSPVHGLTAALSVPL